MDLEVIASSHFNPLSQTGDEDRILYLYGEIRDDMDFITVPKSLRQLAHGIYSEANEMFERDHEGGLNMLRSELSFFEKKTNELPYAVIVKHRKTGEEKLINIPIIVKLGQEVYRRIHSVKDALRRNGLLTLTGERYSKPGLRQNYRIVAETYELHGCASEAIKLPYERAIVMSMKMSVIKPESKMVING